MKVRTILLAAFCLALCAADGPVRTWTDSTGEKGNVPKNERVAHV